MIDKTAIKAAKLYVLKQHNPFNSDGYFNFHFVKVGKNTNSEIYANDYSNMLVANEKQAKDLFFKEPSYKNEYLIKVILKKADNELICEIIWKP